jgi:hypothetical protein
MPLISLVIYIVIFAIVAYGLYWVCTKFQLPQPVMWICGALLIIVLLLFLAQQLGVTGNVMIPPRR